MQQIERHGEYPLATQQQQPPPTQVIELNGALYQVIQAPTQTIQSEPQPYLAQQSPQAVTPISPRAIASPHPLMDWKVWAFVGGFFFVAAVFSWAIAKSILTPPPVAAPAPAPQPIIINQAPPAPPPPPPMPYREKYCEPGGFLGMSQVCTTRDGYR